VVDDTERKKPY